MNHNQKIGKWGEEIADQYLQRCGYTILARNWKSPYGEIDLIAIRDNVITMVEVKTRIGTRYGWPEEAVTPVKQEHLMNAGQTYMDGSTEFSQLPWQVDVIAILVESLKDNRYQLKHYRNAVSGI
ncbi:YraN family protein [Leptolinea tardivitalis]|uniref:UPF0102 protein ADM99_01640 n=1 Tax=Leptolinea tardivitalis TaxID=229920 RepID=A0A0P6XPZ3_9CHLR|nr:YraN family protein [Leptolinea tardivitalis]KPL74296.1 hypothetical protein ADM99_01640 [Leptolinea tardivitalis]GAP20516.1 predicted endonuclease distantly related to archaeal Holliday junction resolvase [Leptolinea tardivitalis]